MTEKIKIIYIMPARLGQHFLKNDQAIKKIIAALDIKPGETIIEIGPGKGALTLPMAGNFKFLIPNFKILAIEKDTQLAKNLGENAKLQNPNIKIINADILKILPGLINDLSFDIGHLKLVGNIPYYITGKLLRTIGELENKPSVSVLMVQKEVAERICAVPPQMNLLAAATQYWAKPEIILYLKASEFDPPPEVDSAVIRLTTNNQRQITQAEVEKYYKLIHIIFKQPRKTLTNNLRKGLNISKEEIEKNLNSLGLPLNSRPQDVSVDNILKLVKYLPKTTK